MSEEDYPRLAPYRWRAKRGRRTWYAVTTVKGQGKKGTVSMHRFILGEPEGRQVDHGDGNGLNNRRDNLRVCSNAQNAQNAGSKANNTSGFKGVSWDRRRRRWQAHIRAYGKKIHLGGFDSPAAAANAYDREAIRRHGPFARLNYPVEASLFDLPAA